MSVVVRDAVGRIIVYCKGADSAVLPVISERFALLSDQFLTESFYVKTCLFVLYVFCWSFCLLLC